MKQIIMNYLCVFIVPALIGLAIRFLLRRFKNGYLVTVGFALMTVIAWVAENVIPNHGSELYGILALMVTSALVGSFVTGLLVRPKAKR